MSSPATLLLVDDEVNILKALTRLLRPAGYQLLTAENGAEALTLLARQPVDLVLSDMRMPVMDGAVFLARVREHWPETMRLLLTGHADMQQTVQAINQGEIYRYIAKPWSDQELLLTVQQALEQQQLKRENRRLLVLTAEQNEALRQANATLENRVAQRTAELQQLVGFLTLTQQELKASFRHSIQVFSAILDMRFPDWCGHSQRVAVLAERLAKAAGMASEAVDAVIQASQLHDLGKMALADTLLGKPFAAHNRQERADFMAHPAMGQMMLLPISALDQTGILLRHQHEQVDGLGFPDHLHGESIPLGARILALARDYDELQMGLLLPQCLSPEQARLYLRENGGRLYDAELVTLLIQLLESVEQKIREVALTSSQLQAGMVLSRDLYSAGRFLLLTKGRKLDDSVIKHIWHFEHTEGKPVVVYVLQS